MDLSQMAARSAPWLVGEAPQRDIVLSSRVRLARNLAGRPFTQLLGEDADLGPGSSRGLRVALSLGMKVFRLGEEKIGAQQTNLEDPQRDAKRQGQHGGNPDLATVALLRRCQQVIEWNCKCLPSTRFYGNRDFKLEIATVITILTLQALS